MGTQGRDPAYPAICAQINSAFEIRDLLEYIGWHPAKLVRNGEIYMAMCPIHRETLFRTLVLNPRNNTYVCKHGGCPGSIPADFLDLLIRVKGKSLPEVIEEAIDHFGADYFRLSPAHETMIRKLAAEARLRGTEPS